MNIDLAAVFGYLNSMAMVLLPLFGVFGVLAGMYLFGSASKDLVWGHKGGGDEGPNLSSIGVKMMIAAIMLQFSTSLEWTTTGLMAGVGGGTRDAMALVVTSTSPTWDIIIKTSFLWLALVGASGVFRGFLLWNKAGSGDNQGGASDFFWRGLWHIIGGAILVNIGMS